MYNCDITIFYNKYKYDIQSLVLMLDPALYYLLLVPASLPVLLIFCYTSWLGWQMFVNN